MGGVPHVANFLRWGNAAAGGYEAGGGRMLAGGYLVAQLEGQVAEVGAKRHAGGDAEISELLHVVENVLARVVLRPAGQVAHVADMRMSIDQRRNDSLATEVNAYSARGRAHLAASADRSDAAGLDYEGGVLDRRAAVAGDQARAFEQRGGLSPGLGGADGQRQHGRNKESGQALCLLHGSLPLVSQINHRTATQIATGVALFRLLDRIVGRRSVADEDDGRVLVSLGAVPVHALGEVRDIGAGL